MSPEQTERTVHPENSSSDNANPTNGLGRISLWAAISGVVLPTLLLLGGSVLSSRVSISDGFVAVCFLLGVGLELVAVGCGIVARRTTSGKAGLIIGSIALALWLATLWTIPTRTVSSDVQYEISSTLMSDVPPLGTITNGDRIDPAALAARVENKPSPEPDEPNVSAVTDPVAQVAVQSADDHERIQGRWDYVTLTTGPRDSIVFSQDKITFHVRDTTVPGTFVLDSTTQPKRIDLTYVGGADGPEFSHGIYQFQNDLLLICFATSPGIRPTELRPTDKQNVIMLARPTKERISP